MFRLILVDQAAELVAEHVDECHVLAQQLICWARGYDPELVGWTMRQGQPCWQDPMDKGRWAKLIEE